MSAPTVYVYHMQGFTVVCISNQKFKISNKLSKEKSPFFSNNNFETPRSKFKKNNSLQPVSPPPPPLKWIAPISIPASSLCYCTLYHKFREKKSNTSYCLETIFFTHNPELLWQLPHKTVLSFLM